MRIPSFHPLFKTTLDEICKRASEYSLSAEGKIREETKQAVRAVCLNPDQFAQGPHGFRCYRFKSTSTAYLMYYGENGQVVEFLGLLHPKRSIMYLDTLLRQYPSPTDLGPRT